MNSWNCKLVFLCFFAPKIHLNNDIMSTNFDSEKVDQDEFFYHKDILHSSQNDPNITHTKNHIWVWSQFIQRYDLKFCVVAYELLLVMSF